MDPDAHCDDGVSVARMYSLFEVLNSTKEKSSVKDEYRELLSCVNNSDKEKRLAGSFITRFVECFPDLIDQSINALVILCEADDDSVRKQVIKDLVTLCGKLPKYVPDVADIYAQLMVTEDNGELGIIHNSLVRLFSTDAEGTMKGLFWAIRKSNEDNRVIIERCLTFLASKIKQMDTVTIYVEKTLLTELKNVADLFYDDEFTKIMEIISSTKIFDTKGGRQTVVDIILEMMKPNTNFDGTLEDNIYRFMKCGEQILKIVSLGETCPGPFVLYCCTKVMPNLRDCLQHEDGNIRQFEMLKIMAEATLYLKKSFDKESAAKCLEAIYKDILDLLPLPAEDKSVHNYKHSIIECYIFVLYKLCSRNPEFLAGNKQKLLDIRIRLQSFARVLMGYIKRLEKDVPGKDEQAMMSGNMKEKASCLKLANNIYLIVKDFFRTPILCGLKVGPSWLPIPISVIEGRKRNFDSQVRVSEESERKIKKPYINFQSPQPRNNVNDRPRRVVSPPRYRSPYEDRHDRHRRGHHGSRFRVTYSHNRRY